MNSQLNLLQLEHYPIYQQLQLEEALLRSDDQNWCLMNRGSSPAIVLGISGQVDQMINRDKWLQLPIPLIRRFSGGGTVIVDEETWFITFICNTASTGIACCPQKVLKWSAHFYQQLFEQFKLQENDYAIGDRKFGGNAQYFRKDRWLHHSSLLWSFKKERMEYLKYPPKTPQYRQQRTHEEFLCRLADFYPSQERLERQFLTILSQQFDLRKRALTEVEAILSTAHRKATTLITMESF